MEIMKRGPGRPVKEVTPMTAVEVTQAYLDWPDWIKAKTVQLGIGVDLLGSLLSLNTRSGNELRYFYGKGCLAISKKTNRIVWVPDSNIRGVEFF